jgi:hypothetical protein
MNPDILIALAPELALFALAVVVLLAGLAARARGSHVGRVPLSEDAGGPAKAKGGPGTAWRSL